MVYNRTDLVCAKMASITPVIISVAVLLSSVALIFGSPIGDTRIYGGNRASPGQYPYLASLRIKVENDITFLHACGGSILSEKFILTAAHCFMNDTTLTQYRVYVGALSGQDGQSHKLKRFIQHPESHNFKGIPTNDIALIELVTSIQFSKNVSPISLERNYIGTNKITALVGYGQITGRVYSDILKFTHVHTVSNEECKLKVRSPYANIITDSTLCTLGKARTCIGDSGSPLAYGSKLLGVGTFSFKVDRCEDGSPSRFTRFQYYP